MGYDFLKDKYKQKALIQAAPEVPFWADKSPSATRIATVVALSCYHNRFCLLRRRYAMPSPESRVTSCAWLFQDVEAAPKASDQTADSAEQVERAYGDDRAVTVTRGPSGDGVSGAAAETGKATPHVSGAIGVVQLDLEPAKQQKQTPREKQQIESARGSEGEQPLFGGPLSDSLQLSVNDSRPGRSPAGAHNWEGASARSRKELEEAVGFGRVRSPSSSRADPKSPDLKPDSPSVEMLLRPPLAAIHGPSDGPGGSQWHC